MKNKLIAYLSTKIYMSQNSKTKNTLRTSITKVENSLIDSGEFRRRGSILLHLTTNTFLQSEQWKN